MTSPAVDYPHETMTAMTKSLQSEWAYTSRVIANCKEKFHPLEEEISKKFMPALLQKTEEEIPRSITSLPVRMAGLGILNPVSTATFAHETSYQASTHMRESIKYCSEFTLETHKSYLAASRKTHRGKTDHMYSQTLSSELNKMSLPNARSIKRSSEYKNSSWLSIFPSKVDNFHLSSQEFRDAVCLRYNLGVNNLPSWCDGCGQAFTVNHALSCKKGGLIIMRHNEVRDTIGDIASLLWNNVTREPVIRDAEQNPAGALVADLLVRGVWYPQENASFDIRVVDTDAPSYHGRTTESVLKSAEEEKKLKYLEACQMRHISFTPLVISVDGALGNELKNFIKHLSEGLSAKWGRNYEQIVSWVRTKLSFAVLRATNMCLRGTRTKWRSLGTEDGAPFADNL